MLWCYSSHLDVNHVHYAADREIDAYLITISGFLSNYEICLINTIHQAKTCVVCKASYITLVKLFWKHNSQGFPRYAVYQVINTLFLVPMIGMTYWKIRLFLCKMKTCLSILQEYIGIFLNIMNDESDRIFVLGEQEIFACGCKKLDVSPF